MLHAAIASYPGYLQNPAKSSLPYIVDDTFETLSAELAGGPDKDVSLLVGPELPKAFEQYSKSECGFMTPPETRILMCVG